MRPPNYFVTRSFQPKIATWIILGGLTVITVLPGQADAKPEVEILGLGYERRGDEIHYLDDSMRKELAADTRIDRPPNEVVQNYNQTYAIRGRKAIIPCKNVDAASFEVLSETYTRDKNKIYSKLGGREPYLVVELPDADLESFEVIGENLARDKNHVWLQGDMIPGADGASAEVVDVSGRVWKDAKRVYYMFTKIKNADPKTFRHAGGSYYADSKRVYWCDTQIPEADVETFQVLEGSFVAKDKKSVYRSGRKLPDIDPATCKLVYQHEWGFQVISDSKGVYLNGLQFLHADPETFRMEDALQARGGKYIFILDPAQYTPVTAYQDKGQIIVEFILWGNENGALVSWAHIRARVADGRMHEPIISPPPGKAVANNIPDELIQFFTRDELAKRIEKAFLKDL